MNIRPLRIFAVASLAVAAAVGGSGLVPAAAEEGPPASGALAFVRDGGIWTARADGTGSKELVDSGFGPSWSPDGSRIAYVQETNDGSSIRVVKANGTGDKEVYSTSESGTGVDWSPDGKRIAFSVSVDAADTPNCDSIFGTGALYSIGADGSDLETVVKPACERVVSGPQWSPDAETIAYTTVSAFAKNHPSGVVLVDSDGGNRHDLTFGNSLTDDTLEASSPSWAPDSSRLVVSRKTFADRDTDVLAVVSTDDESLKALPVEGSRPAWSPDGSWLAFDDGDGIWVAGSDGADPKEILDHGTNVDWRPEPGAFDGSWYAMVAGDGKVHAFPSWHGWGDPVISGRAVDLVIAPGGGGYFVLDETGFVHGVGTGAPSMGSVNNQLREGERPVALTITDNGLGGYVLTNKGQAIPVGDAEPIPDVRDLALQGEIVDAVAVNGGVLAAAADGGVFALNTEFHGSAAQLPLQGPITTIVADAAGNYSLFADEGGVFNYGSEFKGSLPGLGINPNEPIVTGVSYGDGYVLFARDAGAFVFSNKPFQGSGGADPSVTDIVSGDAHAGIG